jgi:cytidyltransferase-like protein
MEVTKTQERSPLRTLLLAIDFVITARAVYKLLEARWKYKYIPREPERKPIRVWVDGVFDMMHFGHANMLRQGDEQNLFSCCCFFFSFSFDIGGKSLPIRFSLFFFFDSKRNLTAKALGDYLVVGVNSSETVFKEKGSYPVMNDQERFLAVSATKWVDEVVAETPYVMDAEYIKYVTEKYKVFSKSFFFSNSFFFTNCQMRD